MAIERNAPDDDAMSSVDRPQSGTRSGALWAVLTTLVTGGATFLVVSLFNLPPESAVTLSILVGGIALLIRFLVDFDRRLATVERLEKDGQADMRRLVGDAFSEINEATALFGQIEASALPTDLVTELVRNSTAISPHSPPIVHQFVQAQLRETAALLRELSEGGTVTYDGEDRDWLLGLTREATASIDGISLASVDHELWTSEFGRRYLDAQRHAVRAGRRVRRIFLLDQPRTKLEPELRAIYEEQRRMGIEVRVLDRSAVPLPLRVHVRDLIIFDCAVGYETAAAASGPGPLQVAETRLVLTAGRVGEMSQLFRELWEVAEDLIPEREVTVDAYLDIDDEATSKDVLDVVNDLAVWLGYRRPTEVERRRGSTFWRAKTTVSGDLLPHQMRDRAARLGRVAESAGGNGSGAGLLSDSHEAQILADLIRALDRTAHACIRVDRLLVLKYTGAAGPVIVSFTLSQGQLDILEQHPEMQTNPQTVLAELGREMGQGHAAG